MKFAVLAAIVTGMSAVSTTLVCQVSSADTSLTARGTDSACSAGDMQS
jgi:hypothetical protein